MITETSAVGSDEVRSQWLQSSVSTIKKLRSHGTPVIGYTWFPLFTMIDWRYRFSTDPLESFYLELGLYRLNHKSDGPRWMETPLVPQLKSYIANTRAAVGKLGKRKAAV
jgi:hypothetical protein